MEGSFSEQIQAANDNLCSWYCFLCQTQFISFSINLNDGPRDKMATTLVKMAEYSQHEYKKKLCSCHVLLVEHPGVRS